MKKLFIILFGIICVNSFAQLHHELVNTVIVSQPIQVDSTHFKFIVNIQSKAIGETFTEFYHIDSISIIWSTSDTQNDIKTKILNGAVTYINEKYN